MPSAEFIMEYNAGKTYLCRLKHGEDLLGSLHSLCGELDITMGTVQAIGALSSVKVAYYDQTEKIYRELSFDGRYEIACLTGNISIRDGAPLCHAHLVFSDAAGNARGGHLLPGCIIFAGEAVITALDGPTLVRGYDEVTGLPLWETGKP